MNLHIISDLSSVTICSFSSFDFLAVLLSSLEGRLCISILVKYYEISLVLDEQSPRIDFPPVLTMSVPTIMVFLKLGRLML